MLIYHVLVAHATAATALVHMGSSSSRHPQGKQCRTESDLGQMTACHCCMLDCRSTGNISELAEDNKQLVKCIFDLTHASRQHTLG